VTASLLTAVYDAVTDGWESLAEPRVVRAYGAEIVLDGLPLANLLVARGGSFFASSRPTLPFTSTLVLRMRCSRVRRFLSEYPAFDFQLSTSNLPARGFPRLDSLQSIQTFALTTFP